MADSTKKEKLTGLFLRALRKVGVLKYLNLTLISVREGTPFRIPVNGGIGLANFSSQSELWMVPLLRNLLREVGQKQMFLDIGANIGQTLLKVRSVDKSVHYIGIEPNPFCIAYLANLIVLNKFGQTEILPLGVGQETTVKPLRFFSESKTDESASLLDDFRLASSVTSSTVVPVFKFADVPQLSTVICQAGIIKIDVEGAELDVMLGLVELMRTSRPYIIIEILPVYNKQNTFRWDRQSKLEALIHQNNYIILRIQKNNMEYSGLVEVGSIGIHNDLTMCDYLLCPTEYASRLLRDTE